MVKGRVVYECVCVGGVLGLHQREIVRQLG